MSSLAKEPERKSMRRLVNFYNPAVGGSDAYGRTLDEILSWPDARLEGCHNYIQMLFPLPELSGFAHQAPVLDKETVLIFIGSRDLKLNVLRALKRMLSFYGFDAEDCDNEESSSDNSSSDSFRLIITPKADPKRGFAHWVTRVDHNHLRITRMLRSLRILGLDGAARDFYDALTEVNSVCGRVGTTALSFWNHAVNNPLTEAPDGTTVPWLASF